MILVGLAAMAVWIFPTILAIDSGNFAAVLAAYVIGAVLFSVSYGPQATFIVEMFDARVRFSAASTSFQMGVLLGGALAPIIAAALVTSDRHRHLGGGLRLPRVAALARVRAGCQPGGARAGQRRPRLRFRSAEVRR